MGDNIKTEKITKKEFYDNLDRIVNDDLKVLLNILEKSPKDYGACAFHYKKCIDIMTGIGHTIELINSSRLAEQVVPNIKYFKNELGGVRFTCENSNLTKKDDISNIYG